MDNADFFYTKDYNDVHHGSSDEDIVLVSVSDSASSFVTANNDVENVESNAGTSKILEADEFEEEYEGENLAHLREVFEIHESEDEDLLIEDEESVNEDKVISLSLDPLCNCEPKDWSWDWTEDDRWEACQSLMSLLSEQLKKLNDTVKSAISIARDDYKESLVRAKTKMYEDKSIIGGTMVGCITRLDAIRATKPFAIVVEEASEVLEPLLFSCLTESTIKLEMIGDHRQLQPSVMSRYDFEVLNKINISMFQRLIEAPQGHKIPSTVLSVQRRMRKNICDLTRQYYDDVVIIEDHEYCGTKTITDKAIKSSGTLSLSAAATGGREIPGIGPHVFLWKHKGAQKRAEVGVSRINPMEAEMACSLVSGQISC